MSARELAKLGADMRDLVSYRRTPGGRNACRQEVDRLQVSHSSSRVYDTKFVEDPRFADEDPGIKASWQRRLAYLVQRCSWTCGFPHVVDLYEARNSEKKDSLDNFTARLRSPGSGKSAGFASLEEAERELNGILDTALEDFSFSRTMAKSDSLDDLEDGVDVEVKDVVDGFRDALRRGIASIRRRKEFPTSLTRGGRKRARPDPEMDEPSTPPAASAPSSDMSSGSPSTERPRKKKSRDGAIEVRRGMQVAKMFADPDTGVQRPYLGEVQELSEVVGYSSPLVYVKYDDGDGEHVFRSEFEHIHGTWCSLMRQPYPTYPPPRKRKVGRPAASPSRAKTTNGDRPARSKPLGSSAARASPARASVQPHSSSRASASLKVKLSLDSVEDTEGHHETAEAEEWDVAEITEASAGGAGPPATSESPSERTGAYRGVQYFPDHGFAVTLAMNGDEHFVAWEVTPLAAALRHDLEAVERLGEAAKGMLNRPEKFEQYQAKLVLDRRSNDRTTPKHGPVKVVKDGRVMWRAYVHRPATTTSVYLGTFQSVEEAERSVRRGEKLNESRGVHVRSSAKRQRGAASDPAIPTTANALVEEGLSWPELGTLFFLYDTSQREYVLGVVKRKPPAPETQPFRVRFLSKKADEKVVFAQQTQYYLLGQDIGYTNAKAKDSKWIATGARYGRTSVTDSMKLHPRKQFVFFWEPEVLLGKTLLTDGCRVNEEEWHGLLKHCPVESWSATSDPKRPDRPDDDEQRAECRRVLENVVMRWRADQEEEARLQARSQGRLVKPEASEATELHKQEEVDEVMQCGARGQSRSGVPQAPAPDRGDLTVSCTEWIRPGLQQLRLNDAADAVQLGLAVFKEKKGAQTRAPDDLDVVLCVGKALRKKHGASFPKVPEALDALQRTKSRTGRSLDLQPLFGGQAQVVCRGPAVVFECVKNCPFVGFSKRVFSFACDSVRQDTAMFDRLICERILERQAFVGILEERFFLSGFGSLRKGIVDREDRRKPSNLMMRETGEFLFFVFVITSDASRGHARLMLHCAGVQTPEESLTSAQALLVVFQHGGTPVAKLARCPLKDKAKPFTIHESSVRQFGSPNGNRAVEDESSSLQAADTAEEREMDLSPVGEEQKSEGDEPLSPLNQSSVVETSVQLAPSASRAGSDMSSGGSPSSPLPDPAWKESWKAYWVEKAQQLARDGYVKIKGFGTSQKRAVLDELKPKLLGHWREQLPDYDPSDPSTHPSNPAGTFKTMTYRGSDYNTASTQVWGLEGAQALIIAYLDPSFSGRIHFGERTASRVREALGSRPGEMHEGGAFHIRLDGEDAGWTLCIWPTPGKSRKAPVQLKAHVDGGVHFRFKYGLPSPQESLYRDTADAEDVHMEEAEGPSSEEICEAMLRVLAHQLAIAFNFINPTDLDAGHGLTGMYRRSHEAILHFMRRKAAWSDSGVLPYEAFHQAVKEWGKHWTHRSLFQPEKLEADDLIVCHGMLVHTMMFMQHPVRDGDESWPRMLQNPKVAFSGYLSNDPQEAYRTFFDALPVDSLALKSYLGQELLGVWKTRHSRDPRRLRVLGRPARELLRPIPDDVEKYLLDPELKEMVDSLNQFFVRQLP